MGGIFVQEMMGDGGWGWTEVDLLAVNLRGLLRSVVIFIHCDLLVGCIPQDCWHCCGVFFD